MMEDPERPAQEELVVEEVELEQFQLELICLVAVVLQELL